MLKVLRIAFGVLVLAFILAAANWAVRDCKVDPFTYENCIWLQVRDALGLHQSKLHRGLTLEIVGLVLLAGVLLTIRYIFPKRSSHGDAATGASAGESEGTVDATPSPRR